MEQFKLVLLKRGCKASTIRRHVWNVNHLLQNTPLTKKAVDAYFISLLEEGKKETYLNSLIDSLRIYSQHKRLAKSLQKYPHFKEKPSEKATLSDAEIERFLDLEPLHKKGSNATNFLRWSMFFRILAYTGARPGEIAKLVCDNIDWGNNCIRILDDKAGKNRNLPIPEVLRKPLKDYCESLNSRRLFKAGNQTGCFNSVQWDYQFKTRLKRLGINRPHLSCYSLRHSFGTSMANEDVDIRKIMKIMGHSRLDTTLVYTHLSTKDIHNAIKKHPLIRKTSDPAFILKQIKEYIDSLELENDDRFDFEVKTTSDTIDMSVSVKRLE